MPTLTGKRLTLDGAAAAAALDFAVTSGLRADEIHASAVDPGQSLKNYEDQKRQYLNTETQCAEQALQFIPMVVEAHGGSWGSAARAAWKGIATDFGSCTSVSMPFACNELAQRLSTALQRENARSNNLCPSTHFRHVVCVQWVGWMAVVLCMPYGGKGWWVVVGRLYSWWVGCEVGQDGTSTEWRGDRMRA